MASGNPSGTPPLAGGNSGESESQPTETEQQELFPAAVLPLLVQNGFVEHSELGRLCLTCRLWRDASLDDGIWSDLCHRRWPVTAHLPSAVVEGQGYRWLYRQFNRAALEVVRVPLGKIAPPKLCPKDLVLLLNITERGASVLSTTIVGEDLKTLLDEGKVSIGLEKPICFGRITLADDGLFNFPNDSYKEWKLSLQFLRLTDNKFCSVFNVDGLGGLLPREDLGVHLQRERNVQSLRERPADAYHRHHSVEIDWDRVKKDHTEANLAFEEEYDFVDYMSLAMKEDSTLLERISIIDLHSGDDRVDAFSFQVDTKIVYPRSPRYYGFDSMLTKFLRTGRTLFGIWYDFETFNAEYWKNARSKPELAQFFQQAEEEVMQATYDHLTISACLDHEYENFESKCLLEKEHGVTLLHLLEQLKGWD